MRMDSVQTIELLSMEDEHGRYAMKLGVGLDDGQTGTQRELEAELDEATYRELLKLNPLSAERVRLSLYAQYDPFRQTYFSSIVKLHKAGSESYYFDCSADYEVMLGQLRRGEMAACANVAAASVQNAPSSVGAAVPAAGLRLSLGVVAEIGESLRTRMRAGRYTMASLRLLLFTGLFLLVWFEVEGQLYIDDAKALSEHQVVISEGAGEGAKQGGATLVRSVVLTAGDDSSAPIAIPAAPGKGTPDGSAADGAIETVAEEGAVEVFTLDEDAPLYRLPEGYVALTFDDGPSDYTKAIVDLLRERGVAGTFLFIGRNADRYPKEAAYAADNGMTVGNHSWDHSNLSKLEMDAISANIEKANEAIAKRSSDPVSVFRPPYGAMNDELEIAVEELGMKMLMWNRDPEDWKADTSEEIVRYFKKLSASGGIYVMHEKKATLDALPDIIDYLLEQKLKFAVFQ